MLEKAIKAARIINNPDGFLVEHTGLEPVTPTLPV